MNFSNTDYLFRVVRLSLRPSLIAFLLDMMFSFLLALSLLSLLFVSRIRLRSGLLQEEFTSSAILPARLRPAGCDDLGSLMQFCRVMLLSPRVPRPGSPVRAPLPARRLIWLTHAVHVVSRQSSGVGRNCGWLL